MSEWVWRPMTVEDLPTVLAIEERVFSTPWLACDFQSGLALSEEPAQNFVVEQIGRLVGFCCLGWLGPVVEIQNIAVGADSQRSGLGRWMLAQVQAEAISGGAEAIWLEVRRGNQAARALYFAAGFVERGIRRAYYRDTGEDAILLEQTLEL